jgi:hypothetical protein
LTSTPIQSSPAGKEKAHELVDSLLLGNVLAGALSYGFASAAKLLDEWVPLLQEN